MLSDCRRSTSPTSEAVTLTRAPGQRARAEDEPARLAWLADCLGRHFAGDWGDLDSHDRVVNDTAVRQHRGRLLSAYLVPASLDRTTIEIQLWVFTDDLEDPDTATTMLWPKRLLIVTPLRRPLPMAGAFSRPSSADQDRPAN